MGGLRGPSDEPLPVERLRAAEPFGVAAVKQGIDAAAS